MLGISGELVPSNSEYAPDQLLDRIRSGRNLGFQPVSNAITELGIVVCQQVVTEGEAVEQSLVVQLVLWVGLEEVEDVPQGLSRAIDTEGIDLLVFSSCKDALDWQDKLLQFWLDLWGRCLEGSTS